ncbi:hypothetical protein EJK15_62260 [Nonomuraea basaltis]|nr:hypothetical protein EJK15_62260 [Nonomuraea basaltis]
MPQAVSGRAAWMSVPHSGFGEYEQLARHALHAEHVVAGRRHVSRGARTDSRSHLTASCLRGTRSSAGRAGDGSCR